MRICAIIISLMGNVVFIAKIFRPKGAKLAFQKCGSKVWDCGIRQKGLIYFTCSWRQILCFESIPPLPRDDKEWMHYILCI